MVLRNTAAGTSSGSESYSRWLLKASYYSVQTTPEKENKSEERYNGSWVDRACHEIEQD